MTINDWKDMRIFIHQTQQSYESGMALQPDSVDDQTVFGKSPPNFPVNSEMPTHTSEFKFSESSDNLIKQELVDETEESVDVDSPFPFETDQAALKENKDYQNLIRALLVLEAQRTMALKDYDTLLHLQREALLNPIGFVHKLQQKIDVGIPKPQQVTELPNIPWEDYSVSLKAVFDSCSTRHLTRQKYKQEMQNEDGINKKASIAQSSLSKINEDVLNIREENSTKDSKACIGATFNQPWSVEEQKQLEMLLGKYQPERFESRRWAKIARELGSRTHQQVASRVQKYFIKLAKLSLPIPGRIPNLAAYGGKGSYHRHQRYNRFLYPSSTFMASYEPPVFMPEEDEPSTSCHMNRFQSVNLHDTLRNCDEEFYSDSETRPEFSREFCEHTNSDFSMNHRSVCSKERKCVLCGHVISDFFWECVECPAGQVILCTSCSKQEFVKGGHSARHLLTKTGCGNVYKNLNPE